MWWRTKIDQWKHTYHPRRAQRMTQAQAVHNSASAVITAMEEHLTHHGRDISNPAAELVDTLCQAVHTFTRDGVPAHDSTPAEHLVYHELVEQQSIRPSHLVSSALSEAAIFEQNVHTDLHNMGAHQAIHQALIAGVPGMMHHLESYDHQEIVPQSALGFHVLMRGVLLLFAQHDLLSDHVTDMDQHHKVLLPGEHFDQFYQIAYHYVRGMFAAFQHTAATLGEAPWEWSIYFTVKTLRTWLADADKLHESIATAKTVMLKQRG